MGQTRGNLFVARGALHAPVWSSTGTAVDASAAVETGHFTNKERVTCLLIPGSPCGPYETGAYLRPTLDVEGSYVSASRKWSATTSLSAGVVFGDPPIQKAFFLGGLGTVPGHAYRGMVGRSFALAKAEVARDVAAPWLRLRLTGAAGSVGGTDLPWDSPRASYRSAASVGIGVSLLWDVLRFDYIHGGQSDRPRFFFSVRPDLWHML